MARPNGGNSPKYKLSLWAVRLYWGLPRNRRCIGGAV